MADEIGKIKYSVEVSTDEANKSLDKFQDKTKETKEAVEKTEEKTTQSFDKINAKALAVATAIGVAVTKMAKEIASATDEWETGREAIVLATGATGDALADMLSSAEEVYVQAEKSFQEIGQAIGEVNTRLGLTGEALTKTTLLFQQFADATGQDMVSAVQGVSKTMEQWNVDLTELPNLLDKLTVAGQISGESIGEMTTELTSSASTLKTMGYSLDEAIGMMSAFERSGLSSSEVLMGMKKSFADSAKAGTDAKKDWNNLLKSIKEATSETEANSLAIDVFGSRIASTLVTSLREGKLDFDEFTTAIQNSTGALESTDKASEKTSDSIIQMKNQIKLVLADLGEALAPALLTVMEVAKEGLTALKYLIEGMSKGVSTVIGWLNKLSGGIELNEKNLKKLPPQAKKAYEYMQKGVKDLSIETIREFNTQEKARQDNIKESLSAEEVRNEKIRQNREELSEDIIEIENNTISEIEDIADERVSIAEETADEINSIETTLNANNLILYDADARARAEAERQKTQAVIDEAKKREEEEKKRAETLNNIYEGMSADIGTTFSNMFKEIADTGKVSTETLQKVVASACNVMGDAFYELGKDLASGEVSWKSLGKTALKALASIIRALAEEMTARAVLAAFTFNWTGAALLGAGAVAGFIAAGVIDGYASKLAVGNDYVPYDGYPASLHRGEMVLTKQEADNFRNIGGLYGMEKSLSPTVSLGSSGVLSTMNINNQMSAVIEVDGTQLGIAVLKNIDDARPFVMGAI